jgi:eukaryotic-like serine/threonine-protein kinase
MDPERLIGQTLEHYRMLRQIGYGGMATVFLAEDTKLEREVAVKVFWPRPGETRDFLRRFAREARVLAQLDHPNILPVYDYGELDGLAYLVTPYIAGGTLKDLLKARKVLSPVETLRLAAPILNALQYAHQHGLIHRDIKPGNMLLKSEGDLVLADFGLVKVAGADSGTQLEMISQTSTAITGTPEYMSPEQIEGQAIPASDIYAAGIVFYEMLTGQRPFQADSPVGILMQQVHEQPRPLRESNPFLPPQLDAAVLRALEKDPARRYASPAEFLRTLRQAASQGSSNSPDVKRFNEPTMPATWQTPMQQPAQARQDAPLLLPEVHRQSQPAGSGREAPFPAAPVMQVAQAQPGPITDPGQPPQAGASMPITPARQYPAYPSPLTPQPAQRPRRRLPLLAVAFSLLVIAGIVAGLAFSPFWQRLLGGGPGLTPTPGGSVTVVASQTPVLSTACPAPGAARAAVIAPMAPGSNANLVYYVNEGTPTAPTFGTLKRYDTVTSQRTEIVKMAKTSIDSAQLSNDGQWILYSAHVQGQAKLGLVRMDGSMAQTLYCAPGGYQITLPQWSLDQKLVVFNLTPSSGGATLYLLNTATGALTTELTPPASGPAYLPRTWLDYTRVLLTSYYPNSASPQQNVYILDTNKGANQQSGDLQLLATAGTQQNACWDFDSSFDGKTIFIDQCNATPSGSSSTVEAQQTSGSAAPTTVFSSSTLAMTSVRVFERQDAFLLATTTTGLYKIALDGSNNAIPLSSVSQGTVGLNRYSQYFWSNVSRDGSLYALESYAQGQNTTYTLYYGSMNGGAAQSFAAISDGTELEITGWTTM